MKIASLKFSARQKQTQPQPQPQKPFHDVDVDPGGNIRYYDENGELHRLDGPAYEGIDGEKAWFLHGKQHRVDGPAVIHPDGGRQWWVHDWLIGRSDEGFTNKDFERWKKRHNLWKETSQKFSAKEEMPFYDVWIDDGTIRFYNEDRELHRSNGPAIIHPDGTKVWFINGNRHRLDGPAVEYINGTKEWWINGELLGSTEEGFSDKKFEQWRAKHVREDRGVVNSAGDVVYRDGKNQLHRLDGPAVEWADGKRKAWFVNGKRHRLDGPAIDFGDDYKAWWIKDKLIGTSTKGFTQEKFEQWKKKHGL